MLWCWLFPFVFPSCSLSLVSMFLASVCVKFASLSLSLCVHYFLFYFYSLSSGVYCVLLNFLCLITPDLFQLCSKLLPADKSCFLVKLPFDKSCIWVHLLPATCLFHDNCRVQGIETTYQILAEGLWPSQWPVSFENPWMDIRSAEYAQWYKTCRIYSRNYLHE